MERMGVIVENKGLYSKVKLIRHSACGSCGACQMGDNQKEVFITALNQVDAEEGDYVEVVMPTSGILGAAFIMYMIPLFALFAGLIIGWFAFSAHNEVYAAVMGLGMMSLAFAVIKINEKKIAKNEKYTAQILSIVQKNHEDLDQL